MKATMTKETYKRQLAWLMQEVNEKRMQIEQAMDVRGGYDESMDSLSESIGWREEQIRDLHWDWLTRYWTDQDRALYEQLVKEDAR